MAENGLAHPASTLPPLTGDQMWSWRDDAGQYWSVVLDYRCDPVTGRTIGYEVERRREERLGNGRILCTVVAAICCRSRVWAEQEARRLRTEGTDA